MKKKITFFMMTLALAGTLCACKGDTDTYKEPEAGSEADSTVDAEINVQELADRLLENVPFKDKLETMDEAIVTERLYGLEADRLESIAFYGSTGASAEEIAVIKVKDEAYTEAVKEALNTRVSEQKEACRDYLPDEVTKLEKAVIVSSGSYVAFCVSEDNKKASEIIEDALK